MIKRVIDEIDRLSEKTNSHTIVVAIDGRACSGKTSLAHELVLFLASTGKTGHVLSIDDFCNPRATRYVHNEDEALQVYEHNFDLERYKATVSQLNNPKSEFMRYRVFNVLSDSMSESVSVSLHKIDVLICEGIHMLRCELLDMFDISVFIEIDEAEQLKRAFNRDPKRGKTPPEIAYKYAERYNPSFAHHISANEPSQIADFVIDNNNVESPFFTKNR